MSGTIMGRGTISPRAPTGPVPGATLAFRTTPVSCLVAVLLCLPALAGAQRRPPSAVQKSPTTAVISTDASLVAGQSGRKITIWSRSSGKKLGSVDSDLMFRGDVARGALVTVTDDGIKVWRGPRYSRAVTLKTPKVVAMGRAVISDNGRAVAAMYPKDGGAGDPDTVGVWDARSGAMRHTLTLDRGRVLGATFSADGKRLAIIGDAGRREALLRVYRLGPRKAREEIRWASARDRTAFCVRFSPDGKRLAVCAGTRLLLWDVGRRKVVRQASTAAIKALFPPQLRGPAVRMPGAHLVAFSADGKQLVTLHGFGVVGVARWSVAPLEPRSWIKRPRLGGTMRGIAWDRRSRIWLITSTYSPLVTVNGQKRDRFESTRVLAH